MFAPLGHLKCLRRLTVFVTAYPYYCCLVCLLLRAIAGDCALSARELFIDFADPVVERDRQARKAFIV
jgi:hypothetical protein